MSLITLFLNVLISSLTEALLGANAFNFPNPTFEGFFFHACTLLQCHLAIVVHLWSVTGQRSQTGPDLASVFSSQSVMWGLVRSKCEARWS